MTQSLSDKTWFIYFKGFQIWLNNEEATIVQNSMDAGAKYVDIEGRRIPLTDCALLKGEDNDKLEKVKKGAWQCEYGYWHSKNEECGHGLLKKSNG